jgi:anti-sigma regulatory factor (Ser/Thr protein kinase)
MVTTLSTSGGGAQALAFRWAIEVTDEAGRHLAGLRRELGAWVGDHPRRDDVVMVVDELVSNALRHGSCVGGWVRFTARWLNAGRLEVRVTDSGRGDGDPPCVMGAPPGGHGLGIVRSLSASTVITKCGGWRVRVVLAACVPEVAERDVSMEDLLDAYGDGDDGVG